MNIDDNSSGTVNENVVDAILVVETRTAADI
jgi:hypothetical protein